MQNYLSGLHTLILTYWEYKEITDLSVYHGFMDIRNLRSLTLTETKV